MNSLYIIFKRLATIFCLLLFSLPVTADILASSFSITSETEEISKSHMDYMQSHVSLPADLDVHILIYSYTSRSEKYIFDEKKNVRIIPQPAVIKFMVTAVHNSSKKVKFFEKTGSSKDEIIRLSTGTINDYLQLIARQ